MSRITKAALGLFALAVVAACAPAPEPIYFDPAPGVTPDRPMSGKYGK